MKLNKRTKKRLMTVVKIAVYGSGLYFLIFNPKLFVLWLIPGVPPPGPFGRSG